MKPISFLFSDNKKWTILAFIGFLIFLQRSPTLFIEYANNDEFAGFIQARDHLHYGEMAFIDDDSARLTKALFLQGSIALFGGDTTRGVHFAVILMIISTSFFLYLIGSLILNRQMGFLAALFYGIFISGTMEQFMSLKPDIVVNFAIMPSFYFFLLYEIKKKENYIYLFLSGLFLTLAALGKQQGFIFLGAFGFYYFILRTFIFKESWMESFKRYTMLFFGFLFTFGVVIYILHEQELLKSFYNRYLYFYITYHLSGFFTSYLEGGETLQDSKAFFRDFPWKMAFIIGANFILWFLAFLFTKKELLAKKDKKTYLLFSFFVITYLVFFAGGGRMSFHYMMINLPFLALIAGYYLAKNFKEKYQNKKAEKWINVALLVPMIAYLLIYYSLITIYYYKPEVIEDKLSGFIVLRKDYRDIADWIKKNSSKKDSIYLFGNCVETYYFADRYGIGGFLWGGHLLADREKKIQENPEFLEDSKYIQNLIIKEFDSKPVNFFVDVSKSPLNSYTMPPLNRYSIIYPYLKKHFIIVETPLKGITVYKRKK